MKKLQLNQIKFIDKSFEARIQVTPDVGFFKRIDNKDINVKDYISLSKTQRGSLETGMVDKLLKMNFITCSDVVIDLNLENKATSFV